MALRRALTAAFDHDRTVILISCSSL